MRKGDLYGFGLTDDCRLGFKPKKRQRFVSSPVLLMKGRVECVSAGLHHSLVLRRNPHHTGFRSVYSCGLNTVGQCGVECDEEECDDDDVGVEFEHVRCCCVDQLAYKNNDNNDDDDDGDSKEGPRHYCSRLKMVSTICCGAYHSAIAFVDDDDDDYAD